MSLAGGVSAFLALVLAFPGPLPAGAAHSGLGDHLGAAHQHSSEVVHLAYVVTDQDRRPWAVRRLVQLGSRVVVRLGDLGDHRGLVQVLS